jgi:hypothetical protein
MFASLGLVPELYWAAAWVFAWGFWVCSRDLPMRFTVPVVAVKVAIPVIYFSIHPSGSIHLLDDLYYFNTALGMIQRGFDAFALLREPAAFYYYLQAMTGSHVGYHLWNLVAMALLGPHYFSPVLLNVGATFAAGWFFVRILRAAGFSGAYCRFALVFFLLHWDVLAWSSFLNMKDALAMTLTLGLLHEVIRAFQSPSLLRLPGILLFAAALVFLRFYVPVVVFGAAWVHLVTAGRFRLAAVIALILAVGLFARASMLAPAFAQIDPTGLLRLPRFVVTPLPWNIQPGYEFLLLPSIFHLLLLVPALAVLPQLWRSPAGRFVVLYLIAALLLYALVPVLQGVRQRFQVGFVFVWLQFHALWALLRHAAHPEPARMPKAGTMRPASSAALPGTAP